MCIAWLSEGHVKGQKEGRYFLEAPGSRTIRQICIILSEICHIKISIGIRFTKRDEFPFSCLAGSTLAEAKNVNCSSQFTRLHSSAVCEQPY